jgi:hypothetical protein
MPEEILSVVSEGLPVSDAAQDKTEPRKGPSINQMGHHALRQYILKLESEIAAYKAEEAYRQQQAIATFAQRCLAARSRFSDFDQVLALAASRGIPQHRAAKEADGARTVGAGTAGC